MKKLLILATVAVLLALSVGPTLAAKPTGGDEPIDGGSFDMPKPFAKTTPPPRN